MKLCREVMSEHGYNWKISKERRELMRKEEEEKRERQSRAAKKKEETPERIENKKLQRKITDTLGELPRNKRIILERELDRERRMTLKEAKEELWKKWRQSKGKRKSNPKYTKKTRNETLEEQLDKIETEVNKYKEELERIKERKKEKEERIKRKRKLKQHWEMLRWIVQFLGDNEKNWAEMKRTRTAEEEERSKRTEWENKTREQQIEELKEEDKTTMNE